MRGKRLWFCAYYHSEVILSDAQHSIGMPQPDNTYRDFIAWSLVGLLPWLLYLQLDQGLPSDQVIFLCLALAAIIMWIFRLTPDFVPGLALLLIVTLLDLVPREIAFSGFYSQVFFLVFGIFVLAALLAETSWLGRLEAGLLPRWPYFRLLPAIKQVRMHPKQCPRRLPLTRCGIGRHWGYMVCCWRQS